MIAESIRPFHVRAFRIYWTGQAVSLVGTWMQQMAQGWVVTRLTTSAAVVGALVVAGSVPMAVLGLTAGQIADRRSRRNILITTQFVMMLLAFGLGALALSGTLRLWQLFGFAVALGVATAFDLPAAQAFAPELVPPSDIARAVALMQAVFHGSRLIGPAVAGVLIERFGEGSAFVANGVSFLAVLASLFLIDADDPRRRHADGARGGSPIEGLRYVRRDPVTRSLLLIVLLAMLFAFPFLIVLMAYYARYVIAAGASGMGSIMSASGFGALCGALLLVVAGDRAWRARVGLGVIVVACALTGLAFARTLGLAVPSAAALSLGVSLQLGTITQVVQQRVPNELRGRVMALFAIAMTSVMPLSGLALSFASDVVGLPRLMLGCAGVFLVLGGALALRLLRGNDG